MRRPLVALACLLLAAPAARAGEAVAPAAAATPSPPPAPPGPQPGDEVVVVMRDGQKLRGRLVSQDATGVTVEASGARLQVPAASIQAVAVPGSDAAEGAWAHDPNRTRYLYSPTGFMLKQGQGYVSQTELILTTVGYGLTDWLTLQAGTALPWLIVEPSDLPFLAGLKVGGSPSRYLHLAGGFQFFAAPGIVSGAAGLLYGTVTVGTEDLNLGVSVGPPFAIGGGTTELGKLLVTVSGAWRVSRSIALVSENWFAQVDGSTEWLGGAAVRFIVDRLGVDAGFLFAHGASYPVPWLDFTWHWGERTR